MGAGNLETWVSRTSHPSLQLLKIPLKNDLAMELRMAFYFLCSPGCPLTRLSLECWDYRQEPRGVLTMVLEHIVLSTVFVGSD